MRLFSSLRSRIFLATTALTILSIGTATYLVSEGIAREAENSLSRETEATARVVEQFRSSRVENYTMLARMIADAPKLKAAVDTGDPPTVQDTADDYQEQLHSNLLMITDKTGTVLAVIGASRRTGEVIATQPTIREAMEGREGVGLLPQPGGLLYLVTVPMTVGLAAPDFLGTLSVGFLLDDQFAVQLKQLTGSDVAFGMDGRILSSSLPAADRDALGAFLHGSPEPANVRLGDEEYALRPIRMTAGPPHSEAVGPVALILRSRTEQLRFLSGIQTEVALAALLAVGLAILISFAVARTITRPLAAITGVMRDVAATGDLTRKIALRSNDRWDDEDAQLLASTFNTLTDSVAQAQRQMSQRERLSSLGRLSTVIAHEVRNPLMIIKAALHTLRRPTVTAEEIREGVTDIDGEVRRLNRVVDGVLDFARPIAFDLEPADLNALCAEAAAAAQATPGPGVMVDTDASVGVITTDQERLRAALVNLVVNARHAVEQQPAGTVVLATRRIDDNVIVTVSDTGVGIAAADIQRIFDPYFTTKRGGTGLGLPITKNVVEGLGGSIAVESEVGRGTIVRITLPGRANAAVLHGSQKTGQTYR